MAVLSKFFASVMGMRVLEANCYETMHVWNPSCSHAIYDSAPSGFWFCLKTYTTFYLLSQLVSNKGDIRKIHWKKLAKSILQSSVFLTMNLVFYFWFFCRIRHALGLFLWPTIGYTNGTLSSLCAILLENPHRVPQLALYLTNQTMYKQLANRGYVPTIPHGENLPFIFGLGGFFYLYQQGRLPKSQVALIEKLYGLTKDAEHLNLKKLPGGLKTFFQQLRLNFAKSDHCAHKHSCISNAAEVTFRNFIAGVGVSSVLTLTKNLKNVFTRPSKAIEALTSFGNFKIPLFLAGLPFLFHTTNCLLTRYGGDRAKSYAPVVAGTMSGLSIAAFPNHTISMYTMWKALYFDLVGRGMLPRVPYGDILLYTLSTGYVLGTAMIEPHSIPKSYYGFLQGLTGNRFGLLNRRLYEQYGFQSSQMFPDYIPKLDPLHCTINPSLYLPKVSNTCC